MLRDTLAEIVSGGAADVIGAISAPEHVDKRAHGFADKWV
jgi:hypothetical protein